MMSMCVVGTHTETENSISHTAVIRNMVASEALCRSEKSEGHVITKLGWLMNLN